jgi:hypothetical protein
LRDEMDKNSFQFSFEIHLEEIFDALWETTEDFQFSFEIHLKAYIRVLTPLRFPTLFQRNLRI